MNNYKFRSKYYEHEFINKEDFSLIEELVINGNGPLIEIPCGAGRLVPIHENHKRTVYLVDRENEMITKCNQIVKERKLTNRIFPRLGDLLFWQIENPVSLILIPKGGLQLLQSIADIEVCFANLKKSLLPNGLIYFDIANPWASDEENYSLLPEFMRFNSGSKKNGEAIFAMPNENKLVRTFTSVLEKDYVFVEFQFVVKSKTGKIIEKYSSQNKWLRITLDQLQTVFSKQRYEIRSVFGNYEKKELQNGDARIICTVNSK